MKSLWQIWAIALVIKLTISAFIPMFSDEAYYWVWSQNLRLSYYDHPPFVSWLFYIGRLFGDFAQTSRWAAVLMAHCGMLVWVMVFRRELNPIQIKWWFVLALLAPLTGPGSLIVTPDIPVMFFWGLSLYFFLKYFDEPKTQTALFMGAALGLGFASKYHMGLFLPLALVYIFSNGLYKYVRLKDAVLSCVTFAIFSAPVWIWNYQNNWESFLFQLDHGLGGEKYDPQWTGLYLLGQFLIAFPPILYLAFKNTKRPLSWMSVFAWGPLLFFFLTSFKGKVEPNWPIMAYPVLIALACKNIRPFPLKLSLGFWSILFVLVLSELVSPWIPSEDLTKKLREPNKYKDLYPYVEKYKPMYVQTYQMAAQISFVTRTDVPKIHGVRRKDFYDYLPMSKPVGDYYYIVYPAHNYPELDGFDGKYKEAGRIPVSEKYQIFKFVRK